MNNLFYYTLYLHAINATMKILGIIPARYASTRFPAKPLIDIKGKSMILRVYEQARKANYDKVIIATDDERIYEHALSHNAEVVMTSTNHSNGTSRCAEVCANIEDSFDVVVNIQGDEPFVDPDMLISLPSAFEDTSTQIATLIKKINDVELLKNPNIIKVVKNLNNDAMYFSRSCIPYEREKVPEMSYYKHIGIYAFKISILQQLANLHPSILESSESLEQLRWLENGYKIKVVESTLEADSIDTPEDLERVLKKYFT